MTSRNVKRPSIRIAVSSCLLGEKVRYDGGHKRDDFLTDVLAPFVDWVLVCPEIEIGLGAPREPMHLVEKNGRVRLVAIDTDRDLTSTMRRYARSRVAALGRENLSGYVLKKGSPSCGMERVRIRREGGTDGWGRGLFASALLERFPNLPVEEEGRLSDPVIRENWIERVFAYHRIRAFWATRWTRESLLEFHAAHELALLAHSPDAYAKLRRLVARGKTSSRRALRDRYEERFMRALAVPATCDRHARVLRRIAARLRRHLDPDSRRELASEIGRFRRGEISLDAPLRLARRSADTLDVGDLRVQTYLHPDPGRLEIVGGRGAKK